MEKKCESTEMKLFLDKVIPEWNDSERIWSERRGSWVKDLLSKYDIMYTSKRWRTWISQGNMTRFIENPTKDI